jgi:DNA-directed RNA polymerase subunit RPC12/RpoP
MPCNKCGSIRELRHPVNGAFAELRCTAEGCGWIKFVRRGLLRESCRLKDDQPVVTDGGRPMQPEIGRCEHCGSSCPLNELETVDGLAVCPRCAGGGDRPVTDGGQEPVRNRDWIAEKLERVPLVTWDRFIVEDYDGTQCIRVYGWIDRDDEHADFVLARFWTDTERMGFTTSSDEFGEYIQAEWFGEETLGDHDPCRRVEDAFAVENCVGLTEQSDLISDGGTVACPACGHDSETSYRCDECGADPVEEDDGTTGGGWR